MDLDKLLLTAAWPQFVMGCINIITYDNERLKHPEFFFIYLFIHSISSCHVKENYIPVIGLSLAVSPLIARRVGVTFPVFRYGAPVSSCGPPADCQRAICSWEGQTQTSKIAVAPLEGWDAFQAVRSAWRLVHDPLEPVLGLCHPNAPVCQAVDLCCLIPLLLHTDGWCARGCSLARVFVLTYRLGRLTAAEELLITSALFERLCASESLMSGEGRPVTFGCLV